jgi:hypothetical protein
MNASWTIAAHRLIAVATLLATSTVVAQTTQPAAKVDEKLVKKLLGGETTSVGQVEAALTGMEQASKKLSGEKDAGAETQKIQKGVLENLDQLIAQARKNNSKSGQKSSVSKRPKSQPPRPEPKPGQNKPVQSGGAKTTPVGQDDSKPPDEKKGGKEKSELARGWGYLPGRDREEVMQGFDEEFLARYREQIMQYYRDLAKTAQETAPETQKSQK